MRDLGVFLCHLSDDSHCDRGFINPEVRDLGVFLWHLSDYSHCDRGLLNHKLRDLGFFFDPSPGTSITAVGALKFHCWAAVELFIVNRN